MRRRCLPLRAEYDILEPPKLRTSPRSAQDFFPRRLQAMKVLKALLAVLTTLAVVLTGMLLFWQDKAAPRYIQIYENEE